MPKVVVSEKPTWSEKGTFPVSKSSLDAIRNKRKLHCKWMAALEEGNADEERLHYGKAVKKVKTLLRWEKRKFEKEIALEAKIKPKAFWAHTRRKL